jgi:hypothetical protein
MGLTVTLSVSSSSSDDGADEIGLVATMYLGGVLATAALGAGLGLA